jgi:hypothetical protein
MNASSRSLPLSNNSNYPKSMPPDLQLLLFAAIAISFLHTVSGPDHYLPFIALSKAKAWPMRKTIMWTIVCGCGHVWSSVLLAFVGAAIGWSISSVKWLESVRGGIAGWALIVFGLVYGTWGLVKLMRNNSHTHFDYADDGEVFVYRHRHGEAVPPGERHAVTPWVMFIIFVLGPCEPMIPLLYFPAAKAAWWSMLILIAVYTVFTIVTMVAMVIFGCYGVGFFKTARLEKYVHALGGGTLLICGAGMVFLNW